MNKLIKILTAYSSIKDKLVHLEELLKESEDQNMKLLSQQQKANVFVTEENIKYAITVLKSMI